MKGLVPRCWYFFYTRIRSSVVNDSNLFSTEPRFPTVLDSPTVIVN